MNKCELYIANHIKFDWFINRWFGKDMSDKLLKMAENNEQSKLLSIMNDIWFKLPDHIFNIIENPEGWNEFLDILET